MDRIDVILYIILTAIWKRPSAYLLEWSVNWWKTLELLCRKVQTHFALQTFFSKLLAPKLRLRPICEGDLLSGVYSR